MTSRCVKALVGSPADPSDAEPVDWSQLAWHRAHVIGVSAGRNARILVYGALVALSSWRGGILLENYQCDAIRLYSHSDVIHSPHNCNYASNEGQAISEPSLWRGREGWMDPV